MNRPYFETQDNRLPFWTEAKHTDECNKCNKEIKKGDKVEVYPSINGIWCSDCANKIKAVEVLDD